MKTKTVILIVRCVVALILIQTLRFKFTAHPDSVYIFESVGLEPYGRIGIGILELLAAILLLIRKTIWIGALLVLGIIGGAIIMHITYIGIEVQNDGGLLFFTALATFTLSSCILYNHKNDIYLFHKKKAH